MVPYGASRDLWLRAAMFTNDIVGNTLGGNGVRDNARIRVFSEGAPFFSSGIQHGSDVEAERWAGRRRL